MCDFNALDDAAKAALHDELTRCADALGGTNFFLQLLEAIRQTKPHPITAANCEFKCSRGTVSWTKPIFKDKASLFMQTRSGEGERGNFLPDVKEKEYKKVLNLVRALAPIRFTVLPKKTNGLEGFEVRPFDRIDDTTTRINPLFDILFFCSVETAKKVLSYQPKTS